MDDSKDAFRLLQRVFLDKSIIQELNTDVGHAVDRVLDVLTTAKKLNDRLRQLFVAHGFAASACSPTLRELLPMGFRSILQGFPVYQSRRRNPH